MQVALALIGSTANIRTDRFYGLRPWQTLRPQDSSLGASAGNTGSIAFVSPKNLDSALAVRMWLPLHLIEDLIRRCGTIAETSANSLVAGSCDHFSRLRS